MARRKKKIRRQMHGDAYYADKYAYFRSPERGRYVKAKIKARNKLEIVDGSIPPSKLPPRAKRKFRVRA